MNYLVNKFGSDKIMHFSLGGLICALMTIAVVLQENSGLDWMVATYPMIGTVSVFIFSFLKEILIDEEFSWKDIIAALLGCITVFVATVIGLLFGIWSSL